VRRQGVQTRVRVRTRAAATVPPAVALVALALALLLGAGPGGAQLLPESPRMLGPATPSGLAVHLLRADGLPGDGDAVMAQWQPPGLPDGVWLRGGAGTGAGGEDAAFGGIDVRAPLVDGTGRLHLAWTAGLGASHGEWTLASLPMGVQAGTVWSAGSVWLAPWVGAGLVMEYRWGDEAPERAFDAFPSAEVGAELSLDPGRRVVLRAGAALGDRQAVALGLLVRTGS
jgi:hypothetical protein